ncbi:MAG: hypothetical protein IKW76_02015, partial [Clostridia bacterium]|nr:hypothetical protein [Clostridia bacterium]
TGGDLQTSVGLFSEGALTISGTGTLTAEAGAATLEVSSNTNYTFGILCWGALTVTGGTVTGRGGTGKSLHRTWGIYAKGFELSFGEVYAYGGTVTDTGFNCGLQSVGTVTVSGGKLTCRGEKTPKGSIGLWTGGNMTVTGGTVDVASGEGSSSGYGIAGGRRGDVLYIGASVESFVSVGTGYAVDDFLTVKNEIPGKGWKTVDGTGNVTEIAANPAPGAGLYMYKKVEFKQFKKYDLWVGDTEVTEECTSGEGWEYAPATNTLTLNNYQYEGAGHSFDDTWNNSGGTYSATAAICYLGSEPLHLVIEDENTVKQTGAGDSSFGILCVTDLDISGTGELNVTAGTATNFSYGIQCVQTLSITGGTIHAFGGSAVYTAGLSAHRFSMDNGEVYAVGGEAGSFSFGIFYAPAGKPDAFCNVAGGKLTCRGGNASSLSCALGFNDSATFSGGEIDLAGGEALSSCGVFVGRAHSSLTICASVDSFVSTGNSGAFDMTFYFKNETDAAAWKNTSGSGEIFTIPTHTEAVATIDYTDYKKIEFPCPVYRVSISGENMTKSSGSDSQTVTKGSAMTDVVYTANDGYYFPADYAVDSVNGVSVTRISFTQITVSGTPDADAAITLPSPTAKGAPDMTVSAESVDVGEEAEVIVTLPADATGKVDVTLTGSKQTYTFYDVALTGGTVTVGGKLKADEYTVTVSYGGNEKYTETAAETTFTVACAHVWNTPTWDWADDYSSAKATFTCADCGEEQTATDNYIDETVVSKADCTHGLIVTYTASVTIDGTEYTDTTDEITVPDTATGHNWEFFEWDWRIDPTLKYTDAFRPDIYYTVKCSACGEEKSMMYNKEIPIFTAFAPTCTEDGWTQYFAPLTYNGENHDCTYIFTADMLGDYAKATGHDWDEWRKISETQHQRVCKNDSSHTEKQTHQWGNWTIIDADNHKSVCSVCGAEQTRSHLYGSVSYIWMKEGDVWKATASRICQDCNKEQTETVTAAGAQSKAPTCTVNGETTYTATFSNPAFETKTKTVADIAALDHDWKTAWSKDGVNHWHDCTRCDAKNDEAAHTYGEVTYTWEQTGGAWKATATRACTVCEWEETETVTATGAQSKAPTCALNGETTYTAQFENPAFETKTKTVDDISALDHAYDAVVTEPTCTEDGYTTHTCPRCGDSYTDSETDALGHAWGEWEIVRTATPNEKGEKKRVCTRCGEVETAEIDELMITSSVDGQTGSSLVVTVPYAKRGAIATTLTAEEPVTYTSSDPKLLTVDENGNVQFMRLCIFCKSATITTVSADGSKVATCKVNIEIKWWQYIIWFFLGSLWF